MERCRFCEKIGISGFIYLLGALVFIIGLSVSSYFKIP